jgi:enoyl-CoA hydratase/carnithine racemase
MTTAPEVRRHVDQRICVLILDRPQSRNALTSSMLGALVEGLRAVDADPDLDATVLAGGDRVFASGADLREMRETSPAGYLAGARREAWEAIGAIRKPIIAAVTGYALGGGCELALACDAVVAGENAVLGQPEVRLGLIPGAGGTQRWARVAGRYAGASVVLGTRTVTSWEAHRMGLVERVVPAGRAVAAATDLASELTVGAPLATRFGKQALRLSEELPIEHALSHERALLAALLATDDLQEGISAFLEKRIPRFEGR